MGELYTSGFTGRGGMFCNYFIGNPELEGVESQVRELIELGFEGAYIEERKIVRKKKEIAIEELREEYDEGQVGVYYVIESKSGSSIRGNNLGEGVIINEEGYVNGLEGLMKVEELVARLDACGVAGYKIFKFKGERPYYEGVPIEELRRGNLEWDEG